MIGTAYPYLILFILNFLEGSIITLGAGLSASATGLNYPIALSVLIAADIISDIFYYLLGRFSNRIFETKFARLVGVNKRWLGLVKGYYDRHGKFTLFFAKMSDILAMPAIILAGVIKMPISTFLRVSIFTSVVKAVALFTAGYLLSSSISLHSMTEIIHLISGICILMVTILMFRYFYVRIKTDGTKRIKKWFLGCHTFL